MNEPVPPTPGIEYTASAPRNRSHPLGITTVYAPQKRSYQQPDVSKGVNLSLLQGGGNGENAARNV